MILLIALYPVVPIVLAVVVVAILVAIIVAVRNAERDASLRAETERAHRVAEDAKCVTPAAAQSKAGRKVRK